MSLETIRDVGRDVVFAVRRLRRQRGTTAIVVLTMALAIGTTSAIAAIVDGALLRPPPFRAPGRLVRITTRRGGEEALISMRELRDIQESARSFASVAAYVPGSQYTLRGANGPEKPPAILATSNLFDVLGVRLLHGAAWPESFDRERNFGLVISHDLWRRQFASDPRIVGKTVPLDASPFQSPKYTIYGVLPPGFDFPAHADLYRSYYINRAFPGLEDRQRRNSVGLARLADGVSLTAARADLDAISRSAQREHPESNANVVYVVNGIRDAHTAALRPYLLLLAVAGGLLWLIACSNVANVLLAGFAAREQELTLRGAIGATRARVIRLLVTEGVLLSVGAMIVALPLAAVILDRLPRLVHLTLPTWMAARLDPRVIAAASAISLLAGAAISLLPALRMTAGAHRDGRGLTGSVRHVRTQRWFVGAQLAFSVLLLSACACVVRSVSSLLRVRPGFDAAGVATFQIALPWTYPPLQVVRFQERLIDELQRLPGVPSAAVTANLPLTPVAEPDRSLIAAELQSTADERSAPYVNFERVSPQYLALMRIPLLQGRGIQATDRDTTPRVAVVSARLASRLWSNETAIGRTFHKVGDTTTIRVVGMAADVKFDSLTSAGGFDVYLPIAQFADGWNYYVARTTLDAASFERSVRRIVHDIDPGQAVFDFTPMRARVVDTIWRERLAATLLGGFGLIALALAAAGVFAVMSFAVRQRRREIAVRLAVGAAPATVVRAVVLDALSIASLGALVGTVAAVLVQPLAAAALRDVRTVDPLLTPLVAGLLLASAGVASFLPAWRAASTDPLLSLRGE